MKINMKSLGKKYSNNTKTLDNGKDTWMNVSYFGNAHEATFNDLY